MELNPRLFIRSIFDNTHETFERTLPDRDGLTDYSVSSKRLWRGHDATMDASSHKSWVHLRKIGSSSPAALCRHCNDIRRTGNNNARVLSLGLVVQEKE